MTRPSLNRSFTIKHTVSLPLRRHSCTESAGNVSQTPFGPDSVPRTWKSRNSIADTVGWKKLWDHALDHGEACITSLRNLVRVVSYPKHAISSCPLCEVSELDVPLPGHIIEKHTNSTESWDTLFNSLLNLNSSCFSHLLCLFNLF